jgi:uncharacterized coiled-coil DUF342 family protein
MEEREFSGNHIAEVIETKLDQLIHSVQEIKEQMHDNSVDISNLKIDLNTLKNTTVTQDEKIAELKKHYEVNKNMIMGVAMTVVTAIVVAILKNIGLSI